MNVNEVQKASNITIEPHIFENYNNSFGRHSSCRRRLGHLGPVQTEHRDQKTPAKGNNDQSFSGWWLTYPSEKY